MVELLWHREAEQELDALYDVDTDAAALMDALFESIEESPAVLESLFRPRHHYNNKPAFEVKEYKAMHKRGLFVMTIKPSDADGHRASYRALVGYDARNEKFYVLAIAHREVAYEPDDPLFAAIERRYIELGIHPHTTH